MSKNIQLCPQKALGTTNNLISVMYIFGVALDRGKIINLECAKLRVQWVLVESSPLAPRSAHSLGRAPHCKTYEHHQNGSVKIQYSVGHR